MASKRTRLEDLLRSGAPDFRVAVQETFDDGGVRVIVHPLGRDGDTLDYVVIGDSLLTLEAHELRRRMLPRTTDA